MRLLALVFLAAFSTSVFPVGDKGNLLGKKGSYSYTPNGYRHGDAVVCRDKRDKIKKVYLLEYAELDSLKLSLVEYDSKLSDLEYITSLADILEREAPDLFTGFRSVGARIAAQSYKFLNNLPLIDAGVNFQASEQILVKNEDRTSKPPTNMNDCGIEKLVIGYKTYSGINFVVQADLFVQLSKRDRRGLILHEALFYSIQRYYGDVDSARTRYIHQRLSQYQLKELTKEVVSDILARSYTDFTHVR